MIPRLILVDNYARWVPVRHAEMWLQVLLAQGEIEHPVLRVETQFDGETFVLAYVQAWYVGQPGTESIEGLSVKPLKQMSSAS